MRRRTTGRIAALAALAALGAGTAASPSQATLRGHNGRLVFEAQAGANRQLFTILPDGTGLTQVTHFKDSGATDAGWSKDGAHIVFTRHFDAEGPNEKLFVATMDADGGDLKQLPKTGNLGVEPELFPDGRRIIYLDADSGRLEVVNVNGSGLHPARIPGLGGDSVCVLPDGKHVAFLRPQPANDERVAIFLAGISGHSLKRISPWGGYADKIDCSPDGKRILFSKPGFGEAGGTSSNVFTMKTDGTDVVQLTHETGGTINAGADSWSPDGSKIAFAGNRTGTYQIYTMSSDGSDVKQVTNGPEAHLAAWGSHP